MIVRARARRDRACALGPRKSYRGVVDLPRDALAAQPPERRRLDLAATNAEREEGFGISAAIAKATLELAIAEERAIADIGELPAGWMWERRVEVDREPNFWVLRSTLLPVPVI